MFYIVEFSSAKSGKMHSNYVTYNIIFCTIFSLFISLLISEILLLKYKNLPDQSKTGSFLRTIGQHPKL